jgi:engulfment/cell motility protein 1
MIHCRQVRDDLNHEALQFVKEQRIRCLLDGAWFPALPNSEIGTVKPSVARTSPTGWRFVRLSPNRRFLQWADCEVKRDTALGLDSLTEKSEF